MSEQLKPGDYIGLYINNVLIYTGVLKDQGVMQSRWKVCQVLLMKNIFQRNFPEIHFDIDIRPATWEQVQVEIKVSRSSCRRISGNWRKTLSSSSPNKNSITSLDEYYRI